MDSVGGSYATSRMQKKNHTNKLPDLETVETKPHLHPSSSSKFTDLLLCFVTLLSFSGRLLVLGRWIYCCVFGSFELMDVKCWFSVLSWFKHSALTLSQCCGKIITTYSY